MNQALSRMLVEVAADTLEKLAFIFAFPAEKAPALEGSNPEIVRVEFSGPFCGGMEMSLPAAALRELAVNMLGAEDGEELAAEQQQDALKELINVVCGNLLPVLAGRTQEFSLRPPYVVSAGDPAWDDSAAAGYLALESGTCRVRMRLDRPLPQVVPGLASAGGAV
jgi:hypothetical protein